MTMPEDREQGVDRGPHPVVRAAFGLLVGLTAGAVVAVLTPRDRDGGT